jgi:hypothetical protein
MYVVTECTDFTDVSFTNGMSRANRVTSFTCKCNLIYAHQKSAAFATPIYVELAHAEQHAGKTSYVEFHSKRIINLGTRDKNSFTTNMTLGWPIFTTLSQSLNKFYGHLLHRTFPNRKTCTLFDQILFRVLIKCDFHCTDYHEICIA